MAKHSKIDMGPLTEDLPEWSISSEIKVEDLKKKETKPDRRAMTGTALDPGFILDGSITSPEPGTSQVPAENAETSSFLDEGISLPEQPADDTFHMLGDTGDLISSLDAEHISSRGTLRESDTLLSVPQEDFDLNDGLLDIPQERKKAEIAGQFLDDGGLVFEQQMEEPSKPREEQLEELIFEPSLERLMDQSSEPKAEQPEELYHSPSLEQLLEESSGVEASLYEASELEAATEEHDEVEEHLGYLANSMKDWEQSENALSEAAAMLLNISGERSKVDEKEEFQSLRQGLDNIAASINRMSASAREDMADVIEQTQRDNELFEAVQAETVTAERTAPPFGQEPEKILSAGKTVQMKTLDPLDESESSGMDVNGIAELYKKPESKRTKVFKHESERKQTKASKHESERKRVKVQDQEFETTVIPEGEETADGFQFVVDKGIVENPVEWRIDASFQSSGQDVSAEQTASAAENDSDVLTVSDVEDKLKKQEAEIKRRRVEKSRMENGSGFAYALSDLK